MDVKDSAIGDIIDEMDKEDDDEEERNDHFENIGLQHIGGSSGRKGPGNRKVEERDFDEARKVVQNIVQD